ncbi:MAG: SpoIIE family protein phosphatase, partial [Prevotella sp.]|nr:SpoIIE family protein phosphatase [Prevotella sp.]
DPRHIMASMNDSNMFVTMFIGSLDLPTGRLRYCNAGHNAPILIGRGVGMLPIDSNVPVGVCEGWNFVTQEALIDPQTTIFLYTDGLTEAEDINHTQFGEMRVLETARNLREKEEHSPEKLLATMSEAVEKFVGDAEQSDDLTMLAIQYTKQQRDVRMQRSITLTNDVQQVPLLSEFVDGVCEEMGFDASTTMQMNLAIEEAVVNVMNYAYVPGTKGDINVEAQANDLRLKFTISDSGTPFDPTAKELVDTTLSVEERPIGGLGIHLVRQLMDSINYERLDGKNILTLRKNLNH